MAIQKLFSVTAKNQLQIVTLLMKGNQPQYNLSTVRKGIRFENYHQIR